MCGIEEIHRPPSVLQMVWIRGYCPLLRPTESFLPGFLSNLSHDHICLLYCLNCASFYIIIDNYEGMKYGLWLGSKYISAKLQYGPRSCFILCCLQTLWPLVYCSTLFTHLHFSSANILSNVFDILYLLICSNVPAHAFIFYLPLSPLYIHPSHTTSLPCCRSREEKESHDLCQRCRVPAGLPHPGSRRRPRGPAIPRQQQWGVHVVLAGPPAQLGGRQEPGGPEQHPQGGHRTPARCPHRPPEEQVLQQPRQHVAGLGCCRTTGTTAQYMSHCQPIHGCGMKIITHMNAISSCN